MTRGPHLLSRNNTDLPRLFPMDLQLYFPAGLVASINIISTLSYAVPIAGVRTGRIAICSLSFPAARTRSWRRFSQSVLKKQYNH